MSHSFAVSGTAVVTLDTTRDTGMFVATYLSDDTESGTLAQSQCVMFTEEFTRPVVSVDYVKGMTRKVVTLTLSHRDAITPDQARVIAYARAGETAARCFGASVDASDLIVRVTIHTD